MEDELVPLGETMSAEEMVAFVHAALARTGSNLRPSSTVGIPSRFVWPAMGLAVAIGLSLAVVALRSKIPEAGAPTLVSASERSPGTLQPARPAQAREEPAPGVQGKPTVPALQEPPSEQLAPVSSAPAVSDLADVGATVPSAPQWGAEVAAVEAASDDPTPLPAPAEPALIVKTGVIRPGGSLATSFREQGIEPWVTSLVEREVGTRFDFRLSQPGHRYRLVQKSDGEVVAFRYSMSTHDSVYLQLENGVYVVSEQTAPSGSEQVIHRVSSASIKR
jgi:hypothetical protein